MKMTIVEAIKKAMQAHGQPMTAQEVYEFVLREGWYTFNALDPVHVVRSQIRRHCVGNDTRSSAKTKHFAPHAGNRYYLFKPVAKLATGNQLRSDFPAKSRARTTEKGATGSGKNTIINAIKQVLGTSGKPLQVQQVYEGIISENLYTFRASEPVHVVRSQLRRHCLGLDFPSASETKHFGIHGKNRYFLLDAPVRRQTQLSRVGVPQVEQEPGDQESTRDVFARAAESRDQVFISYSHRDARWMQRLQIHLKPLEKEGLFTRWDDSCIKPGARWREAIAAALNRARVAVLLISADFLASDFITENELPPLLKAAVVEGVMILPIIVSACRFEKTDSLSQYQAINPPSKPLIGMSKAKQEELFTKVADAIESALYPA